MKPTGVCGVRPTTPAAAACHDPGVDVYRAIASKRDQRQYADRPIPEDVVERILDAGRLTGSSQNKQEWEFVIVETAQQRLAETVFAPGNVLGAKLVVAICGEARPFDVGRCAQNMMVCAWGDGVTSCPNGVREQDAAAEICGAPVKLVLSFGYPARPRNAESRTAQQWSARARRKPLAELVRRV
jgi:nitroreductase